MGWRLALATRQVLAVARSHAPNCEKDGHIRCHEDRRHLYKNDQQRPQGSGSLELTIHKLSSRMIVRRKSATPFASTSACELPADHANATCDAAELASVKRDANAELGRNLGAGPLQPAETGTLRAAEAAP